MEAMDRIDEQLEGAARHHNSKILFWHVHQLRGNRKSELVPVKNWNGARVSDKEEFKIGRTF